MEQSETLTTSATVKSLGGFKTERAMKREKALKKQQGNN